jgi:hypothetical protein
VEYLVPEQIRSMAALCRSQLAALLSVRAVTGRPGARQWRFFRDAVERILSPDLRSDFDSIPATQAAQYKFEVEAKLRKHYVRAARPPRLVFSLIHHRDLSVQALANRHAYPMLAGYCVLVQDRAWKASAEERIADADQPRAAGAPASGSGIAR